MQYAGEFYQEAARNLVDPGTIHSLPFRKDALGRLSYKDVEPAVIAFMLNFRDALWKEGIPMFACSIAVEGVQFIHWHRGDELLAVEWDIIHAIGRDVSRLLGAGIEPLDDPSWWSLPSDWWHLDATLRARLNSVNRARASVSLDATTNLVTDNAGG